MIFIDPSAEAVSGGTGVVGFRVDGPFPDGGPPPGYAPVATTSPTYTQFPMVGTAQVYAEGVVDANPAATLAIQWMLDGAAIVGETAATYTPVLADIGGLLSVQETWTNAYGSVVTESAAQLVTPAMAAATSHKYIDPTLGADDGGPYAEGAAYNPSYPLADGSASPAGHIYSTCKAAYDAASGNGHRYYLRKGYCHDPVSGVFFTSLFTRSNTWFSAYGPAEAETPVLDAVVYLSDATGWTPHGSVPGAWNYSLTGVTADNADVKGRLWVGRENSGPLVSQRSVGTSRRRAALSVANLSLTNSSENAGLWYVTAGSPSVLTVMSDVSTEPPIYWGGIGLVFENLSAGTARGIVMRNGASGNRVSDLAVSGTTFKPLGISGITTDSTCDSNAFVNIDTRSFIGDGFIVSGASAARNITNTYVSGLSAILDSSALESDAGTTNDFANSNPMTLYGFADTTYIHNFVYEGHSVHSVFDANLTSNDPPSNVFVDGVTITFFAGSSDGRAWGGFVDSGYFRNFAITGAPTRSQWGGINFEVAYGTVSNSTNTNKDAKDQYQFFKMVTTGQPTGTTTAGFAIHDVTFDIANDPLAKCAVWFEGFDAAALGASGEPAANAVELYDCIVIASNSQGLIVNGTQPTAPDAWPSQNIHDNVVVNAAAIGQNFSTATSGSSPPTYTTQALNGYFGCSWNSVVTSA